MKNIRRKLVAGIGILTLSGLMFELALVRLLSVVMHSNFSYLAITTALYGLALGGLVVFLLPKLFSAVRFKTILPRVVLLYSLSLPLVLFLLLQIDFSSRSIDMLLVAFGLIAIPFTLLNIALAYTFQVHSKIFPKLYFADLVGAGVGVTIAVLLMGILSAPNVVLASSVLAFVAATTLSLFTHTSFIRIVTGTASVVVAVFIVLNINGSTLDVTRTKFGTEQGVFFSKWNSFSRISASGPKQGRVVGSTPLQYRDPNRIDVGIRIDSDAFTQAMKFDGDLKSMEFMKYDHASIAFFSIPEQSNVLIIGPGGGRDVHAALQYGHQVTGVDINPIIVNDLMKGSLADFTGGLYLRDDVNIVVADGRSFVARNDKMYGAISIPLTDTWSATAAGNLALVESNLYTVEAIEDYLAHLSENGVLSISRWSHESQRLVNMYIEAAHRNGISNPENHIAVVSTGPAHSQALSNLLLFRQPITPEVSRSIQQHADHGGFSIHHLAGFTTDEYYADLFNPSARQSYIDNHPNNIEPVYDNNPFYFFILKFGKLFDGSRHSMFDGGLINSILAASLFTIMTLLIPASITVLKKSQVPLKNSFLYLVYFALVGLAFMFVELPLIQIFILYLEQPVYSFSVVLVSILVFAGLGSYVSKSIQPTRANIFKIIGGIVVLGLLLSAVDDSLVSSTISLSLGVKIVITMLFTAPLAIGLGMAFPLGMKLLSTHKLQSLTPWAWAINGSTSVLASVLAILLAILLGFQAVIYLGLGFYAFAGLCAYVLVRK